MADIASLKQEYSELMQKAKNIQEQIKNFNKKNTKIVVIGSPSSMEFKNAIEQRDPIAYNWKTQIINTDYDYKYTTWNGMVTTSITIRPSIKNDNTNSNNSYKVLSYIRIDVGNRDSNPLIINYGDIKYISKSEIKHKIGYYEVHYREWE